MKFRLTKATRAVACALGIALTPAATVHAQTLIYQFQVSHVGLTGPGIPAGGPGQQAILGVDMASQTIGNVTLGAAASRIYTVTNTGNVAANLTYSSPSAPVTRSGSCSTSLGANASCTVVLTYAPTVASGASTYTVTVSASGTSVALAEIGAGYNPGQPAIAAVAYNPGQPYIAPSGYVAGAGYGGGVWAMQSYSSTWAPGPYSSYPAFISYSNVSAGSQGPDGTTFTRNEGIESGGQYYLITTIYAVSGSTYHSAGYYSNPGQPYIAPTPAVVGQAYIAPSGGM